MTEQSPERPLHETAIDSPVTGYLTRARQLFLLFTGLVVAVYAASSLMNHSIRMAHVAQDDGPLMQAVRAQEETGRYHSGQPALAETDETAAVSPSTRSAMNWVPAVLASRFQLDPENVVRAESLLQGLLLAAGVWYLTWTATRRVVVSAVAMVFCCIATPWSWNLANSVHTPGWNFAPDPGLLALGLLLCSLACVLRDHDWRAAGLLAVAGLVHLPLAASCTVIMGIAWSLQDWHTNRERLLRRVGLLAAAVAVFVLPHVAAPRLLSAPVDHAELMAGLRANPQLWPWGHARWLSGLALVAAWSLLALNAARQYGRAGNPIARLWLASAAGSAVLGLLHLLGGLLEQPVLLELCGLRASTFLILTAVPMVIASWADHIASARDWFSTTAAILCLVIPLTAPDSALLWSPFFVLLWSETAGGGVLSRLFHWTWNRWMHLFHHRISAILLAGWACFYLTLPLVPERLFRFLPGSSWTSDSPLWINLPSPGMRVLLIALAGLAAAHRSWWPVLAEQWRRAQFESGGMVRTASLSESAEPEAAEVAAEHRTAALPVLACLFLLVFAGTAWSTAVAWQRSPAADMLDAQLWARENSPAEANFLVPDASGWQAMARRARFNPFTTEIYSGPVSQTEQERRMRLLKFYGITEEQAAANRGREMTAWQRQLLSTFSAEDYQQLAAEFGVTHLVLNRSPQTESFPFRRAYENDSLLILEPYAPVPAPVTDIVRDQLPAFR